MSIALVFPGQGSQSIGMLSALASEYSIVQDTFEQASEVLGYDLWQLISTGPVETLNQTSYTQPAMLAAGIAVWRVWQQVTAIQPDYLAGHSLGEYTALVAAGSLSFEQGVELVRYRGEIMQTAVPEGQGAMAAILGLNDDDVIALCQQAEQQTGHVASAVNFNSPGQVVVAGNAEAIHLVIDLAKTAGAKRAILLPVSVPSHCRLMTNATKKMEEKLNDINLLTPNIPVIHNVDVTASQATDEIKKRLVMQLDHPVQWVKIIEWFKQQSIQNIIEIGPGKVLMGLTKRIDKSLTSLSVFDVTSLNKAHQSVGEEK